MDFRLIQSQSQKMVLAPQIRQYLRLLQLPLNELEQVVEAELTENPLLEETQKGPKEGIESLDSKQPEAKSPGTEEVRVGESYDRCEELEDSYPEAGYTDLSSQDARSMQERRNYQENALTRPEALSDFLMWQLGFVDLTADEKRIAEIIIGNLDEDGYLRVPLPEIAEEAKAKLSDVEKILGTIQQLDPPGIGARDLREALMIQLKKNAGDKMALRVVADHLPLLEKRDWPALAKILNVGPEEIKKIALAIARLDPKPGRSFYSGESLAVTPDAAVYYTDDEKDEKKFKVEIHNESIPELRISPYYRRMLRDRKTDAKTKAFIREKIQNAMNFLKALELRQSTLREITNAILKAQPEFFEKGFAHLRPLRLKDIAETVGIHESTVSRAIQGKYITTPQGTIPYKSFFSARLDTAEGGAESQKSMMEKIKSLIERENPAKPYSDEELVKILTADGVKIARRTVAKYRELLKILPSHLRRQK